MKVQLVWQPDILCMTPRLGDMSFSEEAQALRELYVRSPWLIDDVFVAKHFRTLKLVDKEVTIMPRGYCGRSINGV